jgi:choline dehydrogenase-like flavoprotein
MRMDRLEFDYVIVGAGSAGCVLANRLSADPMKTVCLIEGGGSDASLRVKVPAGILSLYGNPRFDYGYTGVPQSEMNGRRIPVNRGKALGGSSTINSMIYIRGAREDYDEWASLGCKGWGYDDVLPVFKSFERNLIGQDAAYHGFDGELLVDRPRDPNTVARLFVEAGKQAGLPENRDFNGQSQFGVGVYNVTQDKGSRFSAHTAFVKPIAGRANLHVLTETDVIDLDIDGDKATAVNVVRNGIAHKIVARGEIILSAGAIGSPRILLASGLGPATELAAAGVEVKLNIPGVGKNLRDHIDGMITVRSKSLKTLGLSLGNLPAILASPIDYLLRRKGMLTTNYVEAGGFAKTRLSTGLPDIQFHFVPGYRSHRGRLVEYGHGFAVHTCVLRPKSIGELTLSADGTRRNALIDHRFFSRSEDLDTLVEGIKVARSIFSQAALSELKGTEILPGPDVRTDDEIRAYLRAEALTVYHPVGTVKMGVDDMAVVDPETLKVRGLSNLRVADASIMPTLIGGNTNAPSMMIGDKCARMIYAA